mgnify:CR=1 FL=1
MKILDGNKVIFEGAFDSSKIDKATMEFDGETLSTKYNDSNLVKALSEALYDFMFSQGWFGNDDDETELRLLYNPYDSDFSIIAFCKPYPYDFESSNESSQKLLQKMYDKSTDKEEKAWIKNTMIEDEKESKEGSQAQQAELEDLQDFSDGYETTCFDVKLTDTEKQQLDKIIESISVKAVG